MKEIYTKILNELSQNWQWQEGQLYDKAVFLFAKVFNTNPIHISYSSSTVTERLTNKAAHKYSLDGKVLYYGALLEYATTLMLWEDYILTEDGIIGLDYMLLRTELPPFRLWKYFTTNTQTHTFGFASMGQSGFNITKFPIKNVDVDIKMNYNDDLPYDKIEKFIEDEGSGIAVLRGDPGTGKTYLIRKLISDYPNKSFIWFDQSLLTQATSDAFVRFILNHKSSILILEDCESLVRSREHRDNGLLNTVLNIADGIIGDSLNIKFICTFNTNMNNIDEALLRKGRLKVKYDFLSLTKDKVAALFNKLNIDATPKAMPLCDVFNFAETTGGEKKTTKLGF